MRFFALTILLLAADGAAAALTLSWSNNMLRITSPELPGGKVEVWYLEAFCRSGSTHRDWRQTTIPHRTELIHSDTERKFLRLRTFVEPAVEIGHEIKAGADEVDFHLTIENKGKEFVDVQWFQPCMRVAEFTGGNQSDYITKSFIFTEAGLTMLDKTRRATEALYKGGQVYVPAGINLKDVNPRPISPEKPVNGLIGCFSADNKKLLAMAWSDTQELFQGVIVCLHNDPRIGGLAAGAKKKLAGKIYILPADPKSLLGRYRKDFGP